MRERLEKPAVKNGETRGRSKKAEKTCQQKLYVRVGIGAGEDDSGDRGNR